MDNFTETNEITIGKTTYIVNSIFNDDPQKTAEDKLKYLLKQHIDHWTRETD